MRRWLVVVMWAACACPGTGTGTQPDAGDPYVYVLDPPSSSFSGRPADVTFMDSTGAPAESVSCPAIPGECDRAFMPSGGTVTVSWQTANSPSDTVDHSITVHEVRPGDHFEFRQPPGVPGDCVVHTAPWSGDVDAVIVLNTSGECGVEVPFGNCMYDTEVFSGASTPASGDTVISCPHETYDDIRPDLVSYAR